MCIFFILTNNFHKEDKVCHPRGVVFTDVECIIVAGLGRSQSGLFGLEGKSWAPIVTKRCS